MDLNIAPWPGGEESGDSASALQAFPQSTPHQRFSTPVPCEETDLKALWQLPTSSELDFTHALRSFNSAQAGLWTPLMGELAPDPLSFDSGSSTHILNSGEQSAAPLGSSRECIAYSDDGAHDCDDDKTPIANRGQLTNVHRARSLPNVMVPFGMPSAVVARDANDGLRQARSFDASTPYSTSFCSFPAYDGQLDLARPTWQVEDRGDTFAVLRQSLGPGESRTAAGSSREAVRHDMTTSRVEILNLAAHPDSVPANTHHLSNGIDYARLRTTTALREKLSAALPDDYNVTNSVHIPQLDVGTREELSECQTPAGIQHSPMWGMTDSFAQSSLEVDTSYPYIAECDGPESILSRANPAGVDSNECLQSSMWPASESLQRQGNGFSHLADFVEAKRRRALDHEAASGKPQDADVFESILGPSKRSADPAREGAFTQGTTAIAGQSTGLATGGNTGAGRMEEGCIGSKKRIWYRAPNGQFASATKTISGVLATTGLSNQGQSSAGMHPSIRHIRRRRKSEEVERKYRCDFEGCDKAYGTLNREWLAPSKLGRMATTMVLVVILQH